MLAREKWQIKTIAVLEKVFAERVSQVAEYGHNEDLEPGFGPHTSWTEPISDSIIDPQGNLVQVSRGHYATEAEQVFRRDYEKYEARHGKPTWMHLFREEFAEAMAEEPGSPEAIAEMVQVAALLCSYIEKHI